MTFWWIHESKCTFSIQHEIWIYTSCWHHKIHIINVFLRYDTVFADIQKSEPTETSDIFVERVYGNINNFRLLTSLLRVFVEVEMTSVSFIYNEKSFWSDCFPDLFIVTYHPLESRSSEIDCFSIRPLLQRQLNLLSGNWLINVEFYVVFWLQQNDFRTTHEQTKEGANMSIWLHQYFLLGKHHAGNMVSNCRAILQEIWSLAIEKLMVHWT